MRRRSSPQNTLDAAAEAFAELGVAGTRIEDVASRAHCSRGTIYRYFKNRDELRMAYILREARRIHQQLREHIRDLDCPGEAIVRGMAYALAQVRENPTLSSWFEPDTQGLTNDLVGSSSTQFQMTVHF